MKEVVAFLSNTLINGGGSEWALAVDAAQQRKKTIPFPYADESPVFVCVSFGVA